MMTWQREREGPGCGGGQAAPAVSPGCKGAAGGRPGPPWPPGSPGSWTCPNRREPRNKSTRFRRGRTVPDGLGHAEPRASGPRGPPHPGRAGRSLRLLPLKPPRPLSLSGGAQGVRGGGSSEGLSARVSPFNKYTTLLEAGSWPLGPFSSPAPTHGCSAVDCPGPWTTTETTPKPACSQLPTRNLLGNLSEIDPVQATRFVAPVHQPSRVNQLVDFRL